MGGGTPFGWPNCPIMCITDPEVGGGARRGGGPICAIIGTIQGNWRKPKKEHKERVGDENRRKREDGGGGKE